jgi:hypothetical protein
MIKLYFTIAYAVIAAGCSTLSKQPEQIHFRGVYYSEEAHGSVLTLSSHDNLALLKRTQEQEITLTWFYDGVSGVRVCTPQAYAFYRATRIGTFIELIRQGGSLQMDGLAGRYSTEKPKNTLALKSDLTLPRAEP